jgi:hypothetical protein
MEAFCRHDTYSHSIASYTVPIANECITSNDILANRQEFRGLAVGLGVLGECFNRASGNTESKSTRDVRTRTGSAD